VIEKFSINTKLGEILFAQDEYIITAVNKIIIKKKGMFRIIRHLDIKQHKVQTRKDGEFFVANVEMIMNDEMTEAEAHAHPDNLTTSIARKFPFSIAKNRAVTECVFYLLNKVIVHDNPPMCLSEWEYCEVEDDKNYHKNEYSTKNNEWNNDKDNECGYIENECEDIYEEKTINNSKIVRSPTDYNNIIAGLDDVGDYKIYDAKKFPEGKTIKELARTDISYLRWAHNKEHPVGDLKIKQPYIHEYVAIHKIKLQ